MDKIELLKRFDEIGGGSEWLRKTFTMLAEESPKKAEVLIECMTGCTQYNNFLSEEEAVLITEGFMNEDGTTGAKWSPDDLFVKIESLGASCEIVGMFNKWALFATMNMVSSDCCKVIKKWNEGDTAKYAEACYDLAVAHLTDKDKPKFVRWYFGLI